MADKKISELPENTSPTNSDHFPINNSGITKKMTLGSLTSFILPTKEKAHYKLTDNLAFTGFSGWAGTFTKVDGVTSAQSADGFDLSVDNRAVYTGSGVNKKFVVGSTILVTCADENILFRFRLAINGSTVANTEIKLQTHPYYTEGPAIGTGYIRDVVELSNGDYVELFVTNESNNTFAQIDMNLIAEEF